MKLLTEYDKCFVLACNFQSKERSINCMRTAINLYWKNRSNLIARARIKSAVKIIRELAA